MFRLKSNRLLHVPVVRQTVETNQQPHTNLLFHQLNAMMLHGFTVDVWELVL